MTEKLMIRRLSTSSPEIIDWLREECHFYDIKEVVDYLKQHKGK